MSGGFQQQVFNQPAQAVAGDFASTNPYFTFDAGPGGLVSGAGGLTIGRFAWTYPPDDPNGGPQLALNKGFGPIAGFVHRAQQGLNTTFLSDAGMTLPIGFMATLMTGGDFWVVNDGSTQGLPGQKAFADLTTGKVSFAAAGTLPSSASDSGGAVVETTLTLVGSVSGNLLTVASVSAGVVYAGSLLGSNALGTVQPWGTGGTTGVGGAGTYLLDVGEQSVAAGTTIGGHYGVFTIGTATGTFAVGMILSGGATLNAGSALTYLISGDGHTTGGTFAVSSGTSAQTTHALVGSSSVETKWIAMSSGLAGELVKMSSQPTG